jgi:hypothetical protein
MNNVYAFDADLGRYTGHPMDPRTPEIPQGVTDEATDHALSIPAHWGSFFADFLTKYESGAVKTWAIKPEDVRDQDAATLLVLALTGTNEQAAAARLYLQESFCEYHSELIGQLAEQCDDAHDGGGDDYDWEAA